MRYRNAKTSALPPAMPINAAADSATTSRNTNTLNRSPGEDGSRQAGE